jgi:Fe2+ transport system protein FeoA
MWQVHSPEIPAELTFGGTNLDQVITSISSRLTYQRSDGAIEITGNTSEQYNIYKHSLRLVSKSYTEHGVPVTPVYPSEDLLRTEILPGSVAAFQAALENIPLIDVSTVSWEQVLEVRRDKQALRKIRDLGLWLQASLKCENIAEASDLIAKRIEDYAWALKKHNLKTITGASSAILAAGGLMPVLNALNRPIWEAVAAVVALAGGATAWLVERLIDREDILRGANSEVAILYDAQRAFTGKVEKEDLEGREAFLQSSIVGVAEAAEREVDREA